MPKAKSLSMALMDFFRQEPNAYVARPSEIMEFKNSMTPEEQAAAKKELEDLGYEFIAV